MTDSFSQAFAHLHLLRHPFYQAWMDGSISNSMLRDYASQYYFHVDRFPRYLSAIHSNCEDPSQRRELLENLNSEEGIGFDASHPELWMQFAEGLGAQRSEVLNAAPRAAIQNVVATFFRLCRSSYHEGLGALFAYESQVPEVAQTKLEGLRDRYGITDAKTLAFFEVHKTADVDHRAVILKILEALPEQQQIEARRAATEAAQSLWNFLTEVYGPSPAVQGELAH